MPFFPNSINLWSLVQAWFTFVLLTYFLCSEVSTKYSLSWYAWCMVLLVSALQSSAGLTIAGQCLSVLDRARDCSLLLGSAPPCRQCSALLGSVHQCSKLLGFARQCYPLLGSAPQYSAVLPSAFIDNPNRHEMTPLDPKNDPTNPLHNPTWP